MKCLSVRQPWASFILGIEPERNEGPTGPKDVENRTWPTSYRGPLLIHASKTVEWDDLEDFYDDRANAVLSEFPLGCILGMTELLDCSMSIPSPWANRGSWHFKLGNPRALKEPLVYKGHLGIFAVSDKLVESLEFVELEAAP